MEAPKHHTNQGWTRPGALHQKAVRKQREKPQTPALPTPRRVRAGHPRQAQVAALRANPGHPAAATHHQAARGDTGTPKHL